MGSCFGKKTPASQQNTKEHENQSLNTHERNKMKQLVFINKVESAPKLDLESSNLYQKRKSHG